MNRFCFLVLAAVIGIGLLSLHHAECSFFFASAQSDCCNPPTFALVAPRFARNSSVTVTISSAFTETERQNIITALGDWNTANAANGSGVTFVLPPLTGETPVRASGNQFIGYDPDRRGAENPMDSGGYAIMLLGSSIRIGGTPEGRAAYTRGMTRHEVGHTLGLANRGNCSPENCSVMCLSSLDTLEITPCDNTAVNTAYPTPTPTPTPTPEPTATPLDGPCAQFGYGWFIGHDGKTCVPPECEDCYNQGGSYCDESGLCWTPIVIDLTGNGFDLTDARNGVTFKPSAASDPIRTAWTSVGSDDAFLVLDRDGNGLIDDGTELFGCASPQPQPPSGVLRNGFLALAEFDKPENGGNGNGRIGSGDGIFGQLALWTDRNHNGVSEPDEMQMLSASEVRTIELDYRESKRQDGHGNKFKYRSKVRDRWGAQVGRWAWDVFPVVENW